MNLAEGYITKLGLDEKELKPLHSKLIDKFDMKV